MNEYLTFATAADVRAQLAGCMDWFASDESWHAACRRVWDAAEGVTNGGARIHCEMAVRIMEDASDVGVEP